MVKIEVKILIHNGENKNPRQKLSTKCSHVPIYKISCIINHT